MRPLQPSQYLDPRVVLQRERVERWGLGQALFPCHHGSHHRWCVSGCGSPGVPALKFVETPFHLLSASRRDSLPIPMTVAEVSSFQGVSAEDLPFRKRNIRTGIGERASLFGEPWMIFANPLYRRAVSSIQRRH